MGNSLLLICLVLKEDEELGCYFAVGSQVSPQPDILQGNQG